MPFYLISTTTLCVTYYGFTLWIRTMGFKRLCYTFLVTGDLSESVIFPNFKCPTFPLHLFACLTLLQRMCFLGGPWSLYLVWMPFSSSQPHASFPMTIFITVLSVGCTLDCKPWEDKDQSVHFPTSL